MMYARSPCSPSVTMDSPALYTRVSNQPPPSSVKAAQIVRQPGGVAPAPRTSGPVYGEPEKTAAPASAPAAAEPAASAAQPSAKAAAANAPKTYAERDAEFRKRQQERADAERKAQEEQQKAAQKAADCQRSRGYLKALEDGVRVTRTDPSGNSGDRILCGQLVTGPTTGLLRP